MAKTTWKVVTFYDGKEDVKDIFVGLVADRHRRKDKLTMENLTERSYNLGASCENNDLPGLAG